MCYWHAADRIWIPIEHLFHVGYGDHLNLSMLDVDLEFPTTLAAAAEAAAASEQPQPPKKKKRVRRGAGPQPEGSKVVKLAGNAQCISEVQLIVKACVLAIESDMFEHGPFSEFDAAPAQVAGAAGWHFLSPSADFSAHHRRMSQEDGMANANDAELSDSEVVG